MKNWWPVVAVIVLPSVVLAVLERLRRRREEAPDYVQRIQALKPERPMALPPVKQPQAQKVAPVVAPPEPKTRKRAAKPRPRPGAVTPFEHRRAK